MPFAFLIVGIVLVISGVKGTSPQLLALAKGDFEGKNGYAYWMLSILLIGSIGYIPSFKKLSVAFLVLVLIVLVLKEGNPSNTGGGFFAQFTNAIKEITQKSSGTTF